MQAKEAVRTPNLKDIMKNILNTVQNSRKNLGGTDEPIQEELDSLKKSLSNMILYRRMENAPSVIRQLQIHFNDLLNTVTKGVQVITHTVALPDGTTFQELDQDATTAGLTEPQVDNIKWFMANGVSPTVTSHSSVITTCQSVRRRLRAGCTDTL
jgi:hypothetical protein